MRGARLATIHLLLLVSPKARAFDYFEHEYLGDLACTDPHEPKRETSCARVDPDPDLVPCNTTPKMERIVASPAPVRACSFHAESPATAGDLRATPDSNPPTGYAEVSKRERGEVLAWLASTNHRWSDLLDADRQVIGEALFALRKTGLLEALRRIQEVDPDSIVVRLEPPFGSMKDKARVSRVDNELDKLRSHSDAIRPSCFVPSKTLDDSYSRLSGYVSLARDNGSHFGWDALKAYLSYQALARDQKAQTQPGYHASWPETEAFAFHFIGDMYAAGHVRTERSILRGVAAKEQHDWENRDGLVVRQTFFQPDGLSRIHVYWRDYGDRCLLANESRVTRLLAAFTMALSVMDLEGSTPNVSWNRPIALDGTKNYNAHDQILPFSGETFRAMLSMGGAVLQHTMDPWPSSWVRTGIALEYYPPVASLSWLWFGNIELSAADRISVVPLGFGLRAQAGSIMSMTMRIGPALRWATDHPQVVAGLQPSYTLAFLVYQPLEIHVSVASTPYLGREPGRWHVASEYELSASAGIIYEFGQR